MTDRSGKFKHTAVTGFVNMHHSESIRFTVYELWHSGK